MVFKGNPIAAGVKQLEWRQERKKNAQNILYTSKNAGS